MLAVRSRIFQFGLILAAAVSVSMSPAASQGYTPEQQQACSGDAMRLCGAYVPDVDRITVCMIQNKSQLSPGCRVFSGPIPNRWPRRAPRKPAPTSKPAAARKPRQRQAAEAQEVGEAGRELTGAAFRIFAQQGLLPDTLQHQPWRGACLGDVEAAVPAFFLLPCQHIVLAQVDIRARKIGVEL